MFQNDSTHSEFGIVASHCTKALNNGTDNSSLPRLYDIMQYSQTKSGAPPSYSNMVDVPICIDPTTQSGWLNSKFSTPHAMTDIVQKNTFIPEEVQRVELIIKSLCRSGVLNLSMLTLGMAIRLTCQCSSWTVGVMTTAAIKPGCLRLDHVLVVHMPNQQRMFIDFEWKDRFALEQMVPWYANWLETIPLYMVAFEDTFLFHLKQNCLKCCACYQELGMAVPPWRLSETCKQAYLFGSQTAVDVRPFWKNLLAEEANKMTSDCQVGCTSGVKERCLHRVPHDVFLPPLLCPNQVGFGIPQLYSQLGNSKTGFKQ